MRGFVFGILCGAIVAAIATGIALELLHDPAAKVEKVPPPGVGTAAVESRGASADPADVARKLDGATDRQLAEALDSAAFDRSWERVSGVARALRSRTTPRTDPLTGLAESAVVGPRAKPVPLVALEVEVARRRLVLELRSRDNPATRLLDKPADEEAVRKLSDLFLAEARRPEYEVVRNDAALVLAFSATDAGRAVLARAVREGPPDRALLAARALGSSEDDRAFVALVELLAKDLDPEVRKRAAAGLALSSAVARAHPEVLDALARAARSDADESVRVACLAALASTDLVRADRVRALLVDLIHNPSEPAPVRLEAVATIKRHRGVASFTPADVTDALLAALGTERDGPLRAAIADVLVDVAPPTALAVLEAAQRDARDPTVAEALGRAVVAVKARGEPPP